MTTTTFDAQPVAPAPARRPTGSRLSRAEEAELTARAARGDRAARDRMIEANLGLVHTIASEFTRRGLEFDDLVGEGQLGLFRAVDRFDPGRGVGFATYARYWIREAILAALREKVPTVRLPLWVVTLVTRWRRAERRLRESTGQAPGFDEVADELGLTANQREAVAAAVRIRFEGEADEGSRLDERAASSWATAAEAAEAADERAVALSRLSRLDGRERAIVELRYGLVGEGMTLREVGVRIGLTRERVRQIEAGALAKLAD